MSAKNHVSHHALLLMPLLAACPAQAENGWDETLRGKPLDLTGATLIYREEFDRELSLKGPVLWAKQHADVGLGSFDQAGGYAYLFRDGLLSLRAYQDSAGYHSGNVQSTSALQAYQGKKIIPGKQGFVCTGCYWEARIRFPKAYGSWGAFWLLSPDDPKQRGHLEVDGIEYYGIGDARGHHHAIHHQTRNKAGRTHSSDYTGMDEIADFDWHIYGIDLRGKAELNGKPALTVYFDGQEVARIAAGPKYFSTPFYFLLTLQVNNHPSVKKWTMPQIMDIDYVRVWKEANSPKSGQVEK
ncbi:MAG: glycoside hydrolase family 16 protein [Sphingobium sp.]